jgi:hypothetical protein
MNVAQIAPMGFPGGYRAVDRQVDMDSGDKAVLDPPTAFPDRVTELTLLGWGA